MSLFNTKTFTVTRKTGQGKWLQGKWVPGAEDPTYTITGTQQPINGAKLEALLEGRRIEKAFTLYTKEELNPTDPETKTGGDIITLDDGLDYEILESHPWQNGIINHYKTIVIREKEGTI